MSHEVIIDGIRYVPEQQSGLEPGYISPHFRKAEFACNHCGSIGDGISSALLDCLENMRRDLGEHPVTINSGYRCPQHNANVGGAPNSQHLYGTAADIAVVDVAPNTVHRYFAETYPGKYGLGKYNSFTHFDVRPDGPARW